MKDHYKKIVEITEEFVPVILKSQCLDVKSRDYGGMILPPKGFSEPGGVAHCIDILLSLYYNADSMYYKNYRLLERTRLYLLNLLREQHEDGTQDLKETNFHDATSIGFSIQVLAYTYRLLLKFSQDSQIEIEIKNMLYQFIKQSAVGMKNGGFHTPNHRWVMASALSLLSNILNDRDLIKEIQLYLNEGIDCDEEGEYTERSIGIYNVTNNRSLMIIADELNMPELLEHVQRNLNMVLKYIEPDNTLFTLNSRRQDYGKVTYPINYYESYVLMAYKIKDSKFAYVSEFLLQMIDKIMKKADSPYSIIKSMPFPHYLAQFMLDEGFANFELELKSPDFNYEYFFKDSGVLRIRKNDESVTILEKNSVFLKFQKGQNKVYVRFAGTFFSLGQFKASKIMEIENGYSLNYKVDQGYVRPLPNGSSTNIWRDMNHGDREIVHLQHYDITIRVIVEESGILMHITSKGIENLPCKLEMIFEPGGSFTTRDIIIPGEAGGTVILKGGKAVYKKDGDSICMEGGFGEHTYTSEMRGSEPQVMEKFTVYMTDFTPIDHKIRLFAVDD